MSGNPGSDEPNTTYNPISRLTISHPKPSVIVSRLHIVSHDAAAGEARRPRATMASAMCFIWFSNMVSFYPQALWHFLSGAKRGSGVDRKMDSYRGLRHPGRIPKDHGLKIAASEVATDGIATLAD